MPAPSETFANLEDLLLRGGIAPKHVKRYLRELSEHLADLTAEQRAAGFDEADASARAALGPDAELADAMLKQRDFRSLSARFPWAVYGIIPPLALMLAYVLWLLIVLTVGHAGGVLDAHRKMQLPVPSWYVWTAGSLMFAVNFLIVPSLAFLLAWMAERQRMKLIWPLAAVAVVLSFGFRGDFAETAKGLRITLTTILPLMPRALGGPVSIHWPTFLAQAVLLCLPLAWLLRARRKAGAA